MMFLALACLSMAILSSCSGQAELAVVRTPAEFEAALSSGARHIEIRKHLNFAGWPATQVSPYHESVEAIISVKQSTMSIRARCIDPFPTAAQLGVHQFTPDLRTQKEDQCMIVFGAAFNRTAHFSDLWIESGEEPVWVDGIYVRSVSEQGYRNVEKQVVAFRDLVMTNLTLQGYDAPAAMSKPYSAALSVYKRAYIEDGDFVDWQGLRAVLEAHNGATSLTRCTMEALTSSVLLLGCQRCGAIETRWGAVVSLQECKFRGYHPDEVLHNAEPERSLDVFYSDELRTVASPIGPRSTHSPAVSQAPFISEADAYQLIRKALEEIREHTSSTAAAVRHPDQHFKTSDAAVVAPPAGSKHMSIGLGVEVTNALENAGRVLAEVCVPAFEYLQSKEPALWMQHAKLMNPTLWIVRVDQWTWSVAVPFAVSLALLQCFVLLPMCCNFLLVWCKQQLWRIPKSASTAGVNQQSSHDTDTCCSSLLHPYMQHDARPAHGVQHAGDSGQTLYVDPGGHLREHMHALPAADQLYGSRSTSVHPGSHVMSDAGSDRSPVKDCLDCDSP